MAGNWREKVLLPTDTVVNLAGRESGSGTGGSSFPHPTSKVEQIEKAKRVLFIPITYA
ncbi:Uncharacterised protein [Vibrio cholerae]|uniref:Uncharacterized protein n=1 Tax=Vibrio cholerae TaxID=666 RepID=A0A655XHP1_VIBCL|nr:Uncharacterised protein [Vibrio cholerae]